MGGLFFKQRKEIQISEILVNNQNMINLITKLFVQNEAFILNE